MLMSKIHKEPAPYWFLWFWVSKCLNIRPHALGWIEAFEIRDEALHPSLGRRDGDFYSHMLETSKNKNPINKEKIFPEIFDLI